MFCKESRGVVNMGLKFELLEEDAAPMASQPRGDPLTPAPPTGVRPLALTIPEANQFWQTVRSEFAGKTDKFELFGAALIDYYHMKSHDMAGLVKRMQVVLNGYPDLVCGFNTFLPSGFVLKNDQQGEGPSGDGDA